MKKITLLKLRAAVGMLYVWRNISELEKDLFIKRIDASYKYYWNIKNIK